MNKLEIIGIVGVIITLASAYYGFLEQIEFVQFVSSFLAGAFTTYVFQHRLQVESENRKKEREHRLTMRDEVYGPVFSEMSRILENIEQVEDPDWRITDDLKEMRTQYLFHTMRKDLKKNFYALVEKLGIYRTLYSATQTFLLRRIKEAVKENHGIDVGVNLGNVRLGLEVVEGAIEAGSMTLERAIMQGMHPSDFIRIKEETWGKDLFIDARIGGNKTNLKDFESLYEAVLQSVEKHPLFQKEMKQRETLVVEVKAFLREVESFVVAI